MKNKLFKRVGLLVIGLVNVVSPYVACASEDFAPPTISVVDKLGVNLTNGQVSQSLNTVSIGGSLGISHRISSYTNEFSMAGYRGYQDKFYAITRTKVIGLALPTYGFLDVINVHDVEDSVDFIVKVNGQRVGTSVDVTSGYTYESLGDERHTLTVGSDGYLNWIKPNGTLVRFKRSIGAKPRDTGLMETITYPNDFTINVEYPYKVTTNTGFQLKYIYVDDSSASSSSAGNLFPDQPTNLTSRLVADCAYTATWSAPTTGATISYYEFRDSSGVQVQTVDLSRGVTCTRGLPDSNKPLWVRACNVNGCSPKTYFDGTKPDPLAGAINIPKANPLLWSQINPKYIQAVNSAVENCGTNNVQCNLNWPKATFEWPSDMPRGIFYGETLFKVTNPTGGITLFRFKSFDLAYDENGNVITGETPGQRYSPRLIGVKTAASATMDFTYTYKNLTAPVSADNTAWNQLVQTAGVITNAKKIDAQSGYFIGENYNSDIKNRATSNTGGISFLTERSPWPGTLNEVDAVKGHAHYESGFRNFIDSFTPLGGVSEAYTYTRGNLTKITYGASVVAQAEYPPSCDQTNYKYCNKPIWRSDKKGNKTYYQYHAQSGEVQRVTLPPNKNNVSAVTRYTYEQKQASYYQNGVKAAGSPIWLKTAEKTCILTVTTGDACAGGAADEIVTSYEYNHDNLLMTGMTTTAPNFAGVPETKRSCYRYNMYGNRIGETQPNANLTSCTP